MRRIARVCRVGPPHVGMERVVAGSSAAAVAAPTAGPALAALRGGDHPAIGARALAHGGDRRVREREAAYARVRSCASA